MVSKEFHDWLASMLTFFNLRCRDHGEWPQLLTRYGEVVYYCGCRKRLIPKEILGSLSMNLRKKAIPIFLGAWIIIDGVGSMLVYPTQAPIEHLPRILRIVAGILVVVLC